MTENQTLLAKLKAELSKVTDDSQVMSDVALNVAILLERAYPKHENTLRIRFRAIHYAVSYYATEKDTSNGTPAEIADNLRRILGLIIDDLELVESYSKPTPNQPINITNNITQQQSQNQTQSLSIIQNVLREHLSLDQLNALNAIVLTEKDPEQLKSKFIEKIKSFGENVASNILANILVNPEIWGMIF